MTRIRTGLAVAIAAFLAVPGAALAQAQANASQWACQMAYAEYNQQGYVRGHNYEFTLMLQPDGQFQAGGLTTSGAGTEQFQAQGNWTMDPASGELHALGMRVTSSGFGGQMPFTVGGAVSADGMTLHQNLEAPDSTGTYIWQRMATVCQRQG